MIHIFEKTFKMSPSVISNYQRKFASTENIESLNVIYRFV